MVLKKSTCIRHIIDNLFFSTQIDIGDEYTQYQRLALYIYIYSRHIILLVQTNWKKQLRKKNYFVIFSISEMLLSETPDRDGKRVTMTVYLGSNPDPLREGVEVEIEHFILICN